MIHLVVGANGSVSWNQTRTAVVRDMTAGARDFNYNGGGNAESYAECAACQRELPTALLALDHIVSRNSWTQQIVNAPVTLWDAANTANPADYGVDLGLGHAIRIMRLGPVLNRTGLRQIMGIQATINTADVYLNDLGNLQWLCVNCNSSKKTGDWGAWVNQHFGPRAARPFK